MSAARQLQTPTSSREEFYEREYTSPTRHEFYAGRIVDIGGEGPSHGRIIASATRVLGTPLLKRRCFAVPCCQMVRVDDDDIDAYPDVVVYCEDAQFDARFSRALLEPLVLVEVLSPSTENTDLSTKLQAYFKFPTLTDYLIVWQDKIRLDQFTRAEQSGDVPQLSRHLNRSSRVRLEALNIEFSLGELYRRFDDLPEGVL